MILVYVFLSVVIYFSIAIGLLLFFKNRIETNLICKYIIYILIWVIVPFIIGYMFYYFM